MAVQSQCESHAWHLEQLKIAIEMRNLELDLLWRRAGQFWTILAATVIAGIIATLNGSSVENHVKLPDNILMPIMFFGMTVSFIWTLINRSSKFWYENWEEKIYILEKKTFQSDELFQKVKTKGECKLFGARRFSPSKLMIITSDLFLLMFIFIGLFAYNNNPHFIFALVFCMTVFGCIYNICRNYKSDNR